MLLWRAEDLREDLSRGPTLVAQLRVIRVFLSSPGDVTDERTQARRLLKEVLSYTPGLRGKVTFDVVSWDDPAAQIAMLANQTPQASVNRALPRPAECDIVVVILWSRMGTPLPDNVRKPNGGLYLSGTEWEYEDAVQSLRKPAILVYRRTEEPKLGVRDPNFKEKWDQYQRVEQFFQPFSKFGWFATRGCQYLRGAKRF